MIYDTIGWGMFILFFAVFAKCLWFYYYFSLYAFNEKSYDKFHGKTALIIPVFNEDEDKLKDTIEHAKSCYGVGKTVFINDGSTNNVSRILHDNNWGYHIIDFAINRGKREAQKAGVAYSKDADVFVMMDSDTILQKDSIINLVKCMNDDDVGGATSCILVKNREDNLLTKCISAMYWTASNIWRKAPSNLGFVQVTNGQLSCYRASIIRKLIPRYVSQKWMGVICTLSDDRWLTHRIQSEFSKRIVYAGESVVYTYIPNTFISAYKMFKRWELGSIREGIIALKSFHKNPILVADIWANKLVAMMQMIVRCSVIILAFYNPIIILQYIIIISLISLLFSYDMLWNNRKEIPYKILYSLMNEVYFGWKLPHAILNIRQQGKWSTR